MLVVLGDLGVVPVSQCVDHETGLGDTIRDMAQGVSHGAVRQGEMFRHSSRLGCRSPAGDLRRMSMEFAMSARKGDASFLRSCTIRMAGGTEFGCDVDIWR